MTQEERRGLIREQLKDAPELSDNYISKLLGVSDKTVTNVRKDLETTSEIPKLETNIGADGKERPRQAQRKPIAVYNPTPREERAIQNPAQI